MLATASATCHFSQCQRRHRRRNKASPAAKVQALRGARLKALLALDFCLFMRGRSCKSPDSQYATTDMCSSTPAVRCRRNEGTCTQTYAHKYLWQGLYCQVICTKWPYHRLNDSSTLGSQALLYQRQNRRRNICPPAAKVQPLRGARLKALLALDFCLRILGCSCKSPGRAICHYGYVQEYTGFPYP